MVILFWILAVLGVSSPLIDFGMNKPHMLFQVGTRHPFAISHGFGYWMANSTPVDGHFYSENRLWYDTTRNGLYADCISHDGDKHARHNITDSKFGVRTDIKYQLLSDTKSKGSSKKDQNTWEVSTKLEKDSEIANESHNETKINWFTYFIVENNDPDKVDHKDYTSPIRLVVTELASNSLELQINRGQSHHPKEKFIFKSSTPFKIYPFSMNISESYNVRNLANIVKQLLQVDRYGKKVKRSSDEKAVKWEDDQLKVLKKKDWLEKQYTVIFIYGETPQKSTELYCTNSTSSFQFNDELFEKKHQELVDRNPPFVRHMLFNLFAGMAHYHGKLYTQNSLLTHELDYSFSFTPSRLIFPRGFLWDDGFHMEVAVRSRPDIVLKVIENWIRKIDLFGWVGREQIRGFEVSSMMPQIKFIYQDIFEMNPPTTILPILTLLQMHKAGQLNEELSEELHLLLEQSFWKIEKWFRYIIRTQTHNNLQYAQDIDQHTQYRWRCKDECEKGNFMGSGLDDYPRTEKSGQISKQHIDLISWVYFFADGMEKIADHLGKEKPRQYYHNKKRELQSKIFEESLDEKDYLFKDLAAKGKSQYEDQHVSKLGYMNLFPFLTGMLKESDFNGSRRDDVSSALRSTLQLMSDEKRLLAEDGLRSLSYSDELYGTDENYWRGAVWMPINYMVLRACKKYYWSVDGVQSFYNSLRERLIGTIERNWEQTGYLFQNYHQGKGHRGFPFYGWTTLAVNIINEDY